MKKTARPARPPAVAPQELETVTDANGVTRWADCGVPRSSGNAFTSGYGREQDHRDIYLSFSRSEAAAAKVDRRRREGADTGTMTGLSPRADERLASINNTPQHWAVR